MFRYLPLLALTLFACHPEAASDGSPDAALDGEPTGERNGIVPPAPLYPHSVPTISDIDWDAFPQPLTAWSTIRGRKLWVSPDGDDHGDGTQHAPYRNVSRGLAEARDGDWVIVRGGDYPEAPAGEYRALLFEDAARGVTITSYQGEKVTIRPGAEGINYGADIGADDVTINGIDFVGFPRATILIGTPGRVVRNVALSNITVEIDEDGNVDGIDMIPDNGGEPVVQGVLFHRVRVVGATIGIQCNHGPCEDLRFEGVYVENALGQGSGSDTIAVESGRNIVILDTEVTQAGADGIDLKASEVTIVGARVHDVARNGIKLWHSADVINSVVTHTGADSAVVFDRPGRYRLLNTVVAHHNWGGLNSYLMTVGYDQVGDYDVALVNTAFFRSAGGVWVNPGASLRVSHCAFSAADNGVALDAPGPNRTIQITHRDDPALFTTYGFGEGNLLGVDPGFIDPEAQDYHLRDGSPLRDSGTTEPAAPDQALDGSPRLQGAAVDIGPHER